MLRIFNFIYLTARGAVKTTQAVALTILGPANLRFFGFSLFRFAHSHSLVLVESLLNITTV